MEENIYEYLKLPITTPAADVKKTLEQEIRKWTNQMMRQRDRAVAKLAVLNKFKEALDTNQNLLREHADRYKDLIKKKRAEQEKALREVASIYVVNGQVEQNQLNSLAKQNTAFSEQEILQIIGATIKKKKEFRYHDDGKGVELDKTVWNGIQTELDKLEKRDLYAFLGVSPTTSITQIEAVRKKLYETTSSAGIKGNTNSINKLLGYVRDLLLDPQKRANYDKTLSNQAFYDVAVKIEGIAAGTERIIYPEQYKALIEECTRKGIDFDKAEYLIYKKAEEKQVTIIEPASTDDLRVCRFCGALNSKASRLCKSCGMPMVVVCPGCGRESTAHDELRCIKCGFNIGDMPLSVQRVGDATTALQYNNVEEALRCIKEAKVYWAQNPGINAVEQQVSDINATITAAIAEVHKLCSAGAYYKAATMLGKIGFSSEARQIRNEVETAIQQVDEIIRKARQTSDTNQRIDLYMQALTVCSDCHAAVDMLRQTPPSAPHEVRAKVVGRSVMIEWMALPSKYIKYQVVRKAKSTPNSPSDGETISITSEHSLTDSQLQPGESYYYAVYSKCGDINSPTSVKTQSPMLVATDLQPADVATDIQSHQITFNIHFPKGATSVEMYRDNQLISTLVGSSYIDGGLTTEHRYDYRFVVVYTDCSGKRWASQGYSRVFMPTAPPEAVEITLTDGPAAARLSWKRPAKGTLVIYKSDEPFSLLPGNKVSIDSLKYNKVDALGESVQIAKDFSGVRYFLPVTIIEGSGIVGKSVRLVSIAKPNSIKIDQGDGYFTVRWDWAGAKAVRISTTLSSGGAVNTDVLHPAKPEAKIEIPKGNKSVAVKVLSMIAVDKQPMTATVCEQTITLEALKLNFVDAKASSSWFGFKGKDKYTLILRAESPLPCDIDVLVSERVPPLDIKTRLPQCTISASQVTPMNNVEIEMQYSRRDKKTPLYIRLVPSDRAKIGLIAIVPDMQKV